MNVIPGTIGAERNFGNLPYHLEVVPSKLSGAWPFLMRSVFGLLKPYPRRQRLSVWESWPSPAQRAATRKVPPMPKGTPIVSWPLLGVDLLYHRFLADDAVYNKGGKRKPQPQFALPLWGPQHPEVYSKNHEIDRR
jgi:hypothetical protein